MRILLTSSDVAKRLGKSRRTVQYMVERGDLTPTARLSSNPGTFVFEPDVVDALAAERAAS